MKRLYIFIIMVIICSTLCLPALSAEEKTVITGITLDEAIQKGLARAAAYQDQVLDVKSLELENQSAKMKRYFSLDSNASYLFRSEQMEISFPGKIIKAGAKHNYDVNLSLKQPLFTGNILSQAVKLSELELAAAENEVLLERLVVATEIKTSYFNYFLLLDKKNSLGTLIEQLNLHLQKIENFYKEELVRKTDLLETKRKLKEQELNLEDLNNLIAAEKIRFDKLCGLDIDNVNAGYVENVPGYDAARAEFISAHPVLKTLDRNIEMLHARQKIVKGTYLPQLAGFAELHYGRPGVDFFKNQWQFYFQGGMNVSFKIFDWHKRNRDLGVLNYGHEKVKNRRDDFIREGEKLLKQLFTAKESVEKKITILEDLVGTAEEDVRLKADLYREQQVSNIDYLDALTTKERYISMKNESLKQHELIKVNINRVIGEAWF